MERVRLAKDGRLTTDDSRNAIDAGPLLGRALLLEPGCSLRSFLAMFRRYPLLPALSEFIPAAMEEMAACPDSGCISPDIRALVIGKTMELIGFPGEPRAELYLWLRGLSPETDKSTGADAGKAPPGGTESHLSVAGLMEADQDLRFKPMQYLLDMPLYLGGLKHVVLGDMNRELVCESRFTLFEVVDGLAWELGFRGGTEQCYI